MPSFLTKVILCPWATYLLRVFLRPSRVDNSVPAFLVVIDDLSYHHFRLLRTVGFTQWRESLKWVRLWPILPLWMWTEGGRHSQWGCPGRISTSGDQSPAKKCWHGEFNGPRLLQHKGLSSCSGTQGTQSAKWLLQPRPEQNSLCIFCTTWGTVQLVLLFYFHTTTSTWSVPGRHCRI